jgi:hypothetical protein
MAANSSKSKDDEQTFPIRLVKRPTGDTHWNTALGIYEPVVHAETGEPNSEYVVLATIDGVDVPFLTANAGGVETLVRAGKQAAENADES